MELIGRLKLIADKVPKCETVCDIGTDHAYLPIYLIENGICNMAIASDVKSGPVKIATQNVKNAGLDKVIECRIGDGLKKILKNEADTIVIAGMGGILIKDILCKEIEKAKTSKTIILQPMNGFEILREWLYKNYFEIYDEEMAMEGEKLYFVISARWSGDSSPHEEIDFHIGRKLVEKKDPLLEKYLNKKLKEIRGILKKIEDSGTMDVEAKNKYMYLRDEFSVILDKLKH